LNEKFSIRSHEVPDSSGRKDHWDFFLEADGRLLSWEIQPFSQDQPIQTPAIRRKDHRLLYLDFEGSIPGDRGVLNAIDLGTLHWETLSSMVISGTIFGKIYQGSFRLTLEKALAGSEEPKQQSTPSFYQSEPRIWTFYWSPANDCSLTRSPSDS